MLLLLTKIFPALEGKCVVIWVRGITEKKDTKSGGAVQEHQPLHTNFPQMLTKEWSQGSEFVYLSPG